MSNFSNNKLYDPCGYKEEGKIKYNSVMATGGRIPNGIAVMMTLLAAAVLVLDKQLTWEEKGD